MWVSSRILIDNENLPLSWDVNTTNVKEHDWRIYELILQYAHSRMGDARDGMWRINWPALTLFSFTRLYIFDPLILNRIAMAAQTTHTHRKCTVRVPRDGDHVLSTAEWDMFKIILEPWEFNTHFQYTQWKWMNESINLLPLFWVRLDWCW